MAAALGRQVNEFSSGVGNPKREFVDSDWSDKIDKEMEFFFFWVFVNQPPLYIPSLHLPHSNPEPLNSHLGYQPHDEELTQSSIKCHHQPSQVIASQLLPNSQSYCPIATLLQLHLKVWDVASLFSDIFNFLIILICYDKLFYEKNFIFFLFETYFLEKMLARGWDFLL